MATKDPCCHESSHDRGLKVPDSSKRRSHNMLKFALDSRLESSLRTSTGLGHERGNLTTPARHRPSTSMQLIMSNTTVNLPSLSTAELNRNTAECLRDFSLETLSEELRPAAKYDVSSTKHSITGPPERPVTTLETPASHIHVEPETTANANTFNTSIDSQTFESNDNGPEDITATIMQPAHLAFGLTSCNSAQPTPRGDPRSEVDHGLAHGSVCQIEASSIYRMPYVQMQVEELCELVSIVNQEWLRKLSSLPDLLSLCKTLTPHRLFIKGIQAVKKFFQGTIVNTFEEIFGLMHVACASAFMLHGHDSSYCWETSTQDMPQWQYAISDESERQILLRVVEKFLWRPELQRTGALVTNSSLEASPGLDYARILDRNSELTPADKSGHSQIEEPFIGKMINFITQPLQQIRGIEAFRETSIECELQLRRGLLRSLWEVELMLLSNAKVFTLPKLT
ncbi:hypothetical protein ACLMJK_007605 [Lecanora helva]